MKTAAIYAVILALSIVAGPGRAQTQDSLPATLAARRPAGDLDQMLGPIALYPDPLIAQILPAATQPDEIDEANQFLQNGGDVNAVDQQPWDSSVKALARYPTVLKWMAENMPWVEALGQAWLTQPNDVMDSVQRLRAKAQSLGNLVTTPQEQVVTDNGAIEIVPSNPEVIYVPYYDPVVIYSQPPPPSGFWWSFGIGFPVGLWLNHDFDWRNRHILIWHRDHPRPHDWWHLPPGHRPGPPPGRRGDNFWHPRPMPPGRIDRGWRQPRPPVHVEPHPVPRPMPRPEPRPPVNHPGTQPIPRPQPRPNPSPWQPARPPVARPGNGGPWQPVPHPSPAPQRPVIIQTPRPAGGALIGAQNGHHATSSFSTRGQQSRAVAIPQAPRINTPPPRVSPPAARPVPPPPAPSRSPGNRKP